MFISLFEQRACIGEKKKEASLRRNTVNRDIFGKSLLLYPYTKHAVILWLASAHTVSCASKIHHKTELPAKADPLHAIISNPK